MPKKDDGQLASETQADDALADNLLIPEENGDATEIPPKTDETVVKETEDTTEDEPKAPFKTFETEDEYNAWLGEEREKLKPVQEVEDKKTPDGEKSRLFDPNWQPKDWNEFGEKLLEKVVPATTEAIQTMTKSQQKEFEDINTGFDKEYDDLAKEGKVPARDSEDGQRINAEISTIGATYRQPTIKQSYDLWKKIPQSEGGGLEYAGPSKQALNTQKIQASRIGSPKGGGVKTTGKTPTYGDIHNRTIDDIVDDAMKE